jgi:hypothetical protein
MTKMRAAIGVACAAALAFTPASAVMNWEAAVFKPNRFKCFEFVVCEKWTGDVIQVDPGSESDFALCLQTEGWIDGYYSALSGSEKQSVWENHPNFGGPDLQRRVLAWCHQHADKNIYDAIQQVRSDLGGPVSDSTASRRQLAVDCEQIGNKNPSHVLPNERCRAICTPVNGWACK